MSRLFIWEFYVRIRVMFVKKNFAWFVAGLIFFIFIAHSFALYFSLYWRYWWFDNVLHFLGGLWLASVAIWFIYFAGKIKAEFIPALFILIAVVSFAVFGGVLWEFYEFSFDFFFAKNGQMGFAQLGLADTMSDLFFDMLGGLTIALAFLRKKKADIA